MRSTAALHQIVHDPATTDDRDIDPLHLRQIISQIHKKFADLVGAEIIKNKKNAKNCASMIIARRAAELIDRSSLYSDMDDSADSAEIIAVVSSYARWIKKIQTKNSTPLCVIDCAETVEPALDLVMRAANLRLSYPDQARHLAQDARRSLQSIWA